jgi:polysaccharide export outer membrane protein
MSAAPLRAPRRLAHRAAAVLLLGLGWGLPAAFAPLAARAQRGPMIDPIDPEAGQQQPPPYLEPSPPAPYLQDDSYVIGPGDGLQLTFLSTEGLSTPLEVLNDGTVALPLIGSARISGLTVPQANSWLQELYRAQLLRPDLQLSVSRPRPLRIALVGEVARPGLYTLTSSEASRTDVAVAITGLPTLVDAIQKAGGITQYADLRSVTVQRRLPGTTPNYKRARVNLLALIRDGDQTQNPLLFDGDTIRLEKAREEIRELAELSSTTLAPTKITVNVIGEVKAPGPLTLPANTPLMQAVLTAGGVAEWRAKRNRLELVRINRNGTASRGVYSLDYDAGMSLAKNPPLRDGDTVIVNRSLYAKTTDAISAVAQPLSGLVNMLALIRIIDDINDDN